MILYIYIKKHNLHFNIIFDIADSAEEGANGAEQFFGSVSITGSSHFGFFLMWAKFLHQILYEPKNRKN